MKNPIIQQSIILFMILLLVSCWEQNKVIKIVDNTPVVENQGTWTVSDTGSTSENITTEKVISPIKWSSIFEEWETRNITNAIALDLPKDSASFALHNATESILKDSHDNELGDFLGDFIITNSTSSEQYGMVTLKVKGNLYGMAMMSATNISDDQTIKDWIIKTSRKIHENYCKEFGTWDIRKEKDDGKCSTKINYIKELPNGFVWNNDFIGEPQIVSIKIPGYILNFELGQDQSEDLLDFVIDIAETVK